MVGGQRYHARKVYQFSRHASSRAIVWYCRHNGLNLRHSFDRYHPLGRFSRRFSGATTQKLLLAMPVRGSPRRDECRYGSRASRDCKGSHPVSIHPHALVSSQAKLGTDVQIGPFSIIEADVEIGDGCKIESSVVIKAGTILGKHNQVCEGTVLGGAPQHARPPAKQGGLEIGEHNIIRENVTIHRALHEGGMTTIGDHNLVMVGAHIAHDCHVANNTMFANNALLAGHVTVDERAYVSGSVGIHQFCRIGKLAMVGGHARIVQDVPPYVTVDGATGLIVGLNLVGLRRNGFTSGEIADLKAAYRVIYRSGMMWSEVLAELKRQFSHGPAAMFHEFLSQGTRGFIQERRMPPTATLKLRRDDNEEAATVATPPAEVADTIEFKVRAG
jgi:UDP-N-acetylglucosamine acyltransferase